MATPSGSHNQVCAAHRHTPQAARRSTLNTHATPSPDHQISAVSAAAVVCSSSISSTRCEMEHILEAVQPYGMLTAGALFGAGWACWCDVIVRSSLVLHSTVAFVYYLPGIVATLAVILMSLLGRDSDEYVGYGDDGDQCRNKCGLFLAYCCSFGSIAGSVVVLLLLKQQGGDMMIGVGSVCQTAILCLAGLITWLCKSNEASDYSLLGW